MTVRELAEKLNNVKEELQDKEVKIKLPNGLDAPPDIIFVLKSCYRGKTKENVEFISLN